MLLFTVKVTLSQLFANFLHYRTIFAKTTSILSISHTFHSKSVLATSPSSNTRQNSHFKVSSIPLNRQILPFKMPPKSPRSDYSISTYKLQTKPPPPSTNCSLFVHFLPLFVQFPTHFLIANVQSNLFTVLPLLLPSQHRPQPITVKPKSTPLSTIVHYLQQFPTTLTTLQHTHIQSHSL